MSKKKRKSIPTHPPKQNKNGHIYIGTISAMDIYKMQKPRSCDVITGRGGIHGDTKYNRRKTKAETRRIIKDNE